MTQDIIVDDQGMAKVSPLNKRVTQMPLILEKITDPNVPVSDISRLISVEIASLLNGLTEIMDDPSVYEYRVKPYTEAIKSLRELGRQLNDTELLAKKDILSFDGPKFRYVLSELINMFKKAINMAGVEESLQNGIIKNFRDILVTEEATLRRETEKIVS